MITEETVDKGLDTFILDIEDDLRNAVSYLMLYRFPDTPHHEQVKQLVKELGKYYERPYLNFGQTRERGFLLDKIMMDHYAPYLNRTEGGK